MDEISCNILIIAELLYHDITAIVMVSYREVPGDTKPYHEPGAYSEPWTCVIQFGIVKAGLVSGKDN